MAAIKLYVGVPENPKEMIVDDSQTAETILQEAGFNNNGSVQLNGRTISLAQTRSTSLSELGAVANDTLFVVKKLANA